jgi:hypothetical protein
MKLRRGTTFTLTSLAMFIFSYGLLFISTPGSLWQRCYQIMVDVNHHKLLTISMLSFGALIVALINMIYPIFKLLGIQALWKKLKSLAEFATNVAERQALEEELRASKQAIMELEMRWCELELRLKHLEQPIAKASKKPVF